MNKRFSDSFPSLKGQTAEGEPYVFLDGPAGTQVPISVMEAVSGYYRHANANSHGQFPTSCLTTAVVDQCRETMAAFLGAGQPGEIAFGPNMTGLAFALARAFGRLFKPGDEVLITQLDHEANRGPWLSLRERGIVVREIALQTGGILDYADLEAKLGPRTRLVAVGYASNLLGTVNDLEVFRRLSHQVGAWLLVDAVHGAPHFHLDVKALDCDFLLCSGYKFYGPHVGVLYSREGLLDSLDTDRLRTAAQAAPDRIETGTPNFAAIAGLHAAVHFLASHGKGRTLREQISDAMSALGQYEKTLFLRLWRGLERIPGIVLHGPSPEAPLRAPTLSFHSVRFDPETMCRKLGERGIFAWDGHFYAIRALEILGLRARGGVVRMGISGYITEKDVDRALEMVQSIHLD